MNRAIVKLSVVYTFLCVGFINCNLDNQGFDDMQNCSLQAFDDTVREQISLLLEEGKKVLFLKLNFQGKLPMALDEYNGNLYQPLEYVRTVGRHGRSLLYLRPQFVFLSLTTLSFETEYITVSLKQYPNNCLSDANTTIIEEKLQALLLADFKPGPEGGSMSEHEHICNVHIKNDNSRAKFFYRCCHKNVNGQIVCEDLLYDYWINIVFLCVTVINVVAVMFSPYLIPSSIYRKKYGKNVYEHVLSSPLKLRVVRTNRPSRTVNNTNGVNISNLRTTMPAFYEQIKKLPMGITKSFTVEKLELNVQHRKLIPANYVPISVFKTFYSMFIKCNIRKTSKFNRCCKSSLFGKCCNKQERDTSSDTGQNGKGIKAKLPWYKCLRMLMRIILLAVVSVPWVARIVFFYRFEEAHIDAQRQAAEKRNMSLPFQWNLTNTLTPIHIIFLICYVIFVLDGVVFGIISHEVKEKLQFLMRKCLRDMRDMSRSKALRWSVLILMLPFEICGVFGFIFFGLYAVLVLPFILLVITFYCLPTVNVVVRLLIHFFAYMVPYGGACFSRSFCISCMHLKKSVYDLFYIDVISYNETVERPQVVSMKNRVLQLIVLVACLFTVFSFVLLAMEIILFFTDIFIYTIIGIVMNASAVLKYISLIFMLVLYARDCFNGISDKYLAFNKLMNRLVVDKLRDKVEKVASLTPGEQKNIAFQLEIDSDDLEETNKEINESENVKLLVKSGVIKWQVPRLILFLDQNDKPYLTEKFFSASCYMDTVGVPGPLVYNLVRATWRFLCICVFLIFVVFIVLAFGDEYQISGTNQMLATLAGGFLPWVFRNVLFKSKDALSLDTKNLSFKSNLNHIIEKYVQSLDVADMHVHDNMEEDGDDCDINTKETDSFLQSKNEINAKSENDDKLIHSSKEKIQEALEAPYNDSIVDLIVYNNSRKSV